MIKPNNILVTAEQINAGNSVFELISVNEYYFYENGQKTDKLEGFRYIVLTKRKAGSEKISVKIQSKYPAITPDRLEESDEAVNVSFSGFKGKFYETNIDYGFTASADDISIIKSDDLKDLFEAN